MEGDESDANLAPSDYRGDFSRVQPGRYLGSIIQASGWSVRETGTQTFCPTRCWNWVFPGNLRMRIWLLWRSLPVSRV